MAEIKLTPQQQSVVDHRGGALLVSAAAGSGKTKVLVDRLMGFLTDENAPCNIDSFLLITYTKAAAAEMRAKIAAELSVRLAKDPSNRHLQRQLVRLHAAQISTVHAFCTGLLREHAHELALTADFRVMEQNEAATLRLQVLEQLLETAYNGVEHDPARMLLFDTLGAGRDDRNLQNVLLPLYEQVLCHPDPEGWMEECISQLQNDEVTDAAETKWGKMLLDRLHEVIKTACSRLQMACDEMVGIEALEKAYLPTYRQNLADLQALGTLSRWDDIVQAGVPGKGRIAAARKFEDKELLERLQYLRNEAFESVKKAMQAFASPSAVVLEDQKIASQALIALFALLREFVQAVDAEKRRLHALDFSDLEHYALKLLRRKDGAPTEVAKQVSERYRQILVDEYQDTNAVQDAIFRAVSRDGRNCFFVGDVKQSIYRFRLADPGIFLEKYHRFPMKEGIRQPDGCKILLSQNFRSRPDILAAVNDVFCGVMSEAVGELDYGENERLYPGREVLDIDGCEVELHCIATGRGDDTPGKVAAEAAFAAERISKMLSQDESVEDHGEVRPIRPEDIVILMRSPRSTAPVYLSALWAAGIPAAFEQTGELLDTMEVQLLHSMLQVIDNPRQDIPLAAVLLSPLFCFRASELAMIRGRNRKGCLYEALSADKTPQCAVFLEKLQTLRTLRFALPLDEFVQTVVRELELEVLLLSMTDGQQRLENLKAFLQYLASTRKSLSQVLRSIEDLRQQGSGIPVAPAAADSAVRIMSIHSSKGLEFPVVLLCDLSRRFNLEDLKAQVLTHPKWGAASVAVDAVRKVRYPTIGKLALADVKRAESRSEELRILYVAMTRARERLIMSYCASNLDNTLKELSVDMTYPVPPVQAAEVSCMGDWVLQTAITRMDAGALHCFGRPRALRMTNERWHIEYHEPIFDANREANEEEQIGKRHIWPGDESLIGLLSGEYPHVGSLTVPMKLTATQLKGRMLDEELTDAAELLPARRTMKFPIPDFTTERALTPAEKGTAMHQFMQFADYAACGDLAGIEAECDRLYKQEFLTKQQIDVVDREKILAFFTSDLGRRVLADPAPIREFKFSVLEPAGKYYPSAGNDEVLLQGVVDCCLNEPDGLMVIDFKTDRILPGQENERGEYYRGQLQAYSDALTRIFEKPVKAMCVYFFATNTAVEL